MAVDVQRVIEQYEDRAAAMPMHGQRGEIRRAPSSDQKKERRLMTKRAELEHLPERELLALASHRHVDEVERRELLAEVERRRTAAAVERDSGLDEVIAGARIRNETMPGLVHDLSTTNSDWLVDLPQHTAALDEVSHRMTVEATLWYDRVPDMVKEWGPEYGEQALGLASRLASQHVDHYDAARIAFVAQAERLWRLGARNQDFLIKEGILPLLVRAVPALIGGMVGGGASDDEGGQQADKPDVSDHADAFADKVTASLADPLERHTALLEQHEAAMQHEAWAQLLIRAAPAAAAGIKQRTTPLILNNLINGKGGDDDPPGSGPVKAGTPAPDPDADPDDPKDDKFKRDWEWRGPKPFNDFTSDALSGRPAQNIQYAWSPHQGSLDPKAAAMTTQHENDIDIIFGTKTAASGLPQVGEQGLPTDAFAQTGYPQMDTSSDRSPVLQELAANQGLHDTSLVAGADGAQQDASANDPKGFPVSGSAQRADAILARTASKENTMQHTASGPCPSCSGTGKVAVRQVTAYSGLPQIDQIVNADETELRTPLPTDVAFPLTWDANAVPNAINQTENFIADRNRKSPLMAQGAYDGSGWMSNQPVGPAPGGKGQNYPGYSSPVYDGSTNEGYADPVYGYGGDQAPRQLSEHGAQEVNDETNVPHDQYGYVGPFNNDQGYREVAPGMTTQGSRDPYIHAAQQEILRQQDIIRRRMQG